ncbi:MAG TPA: metallo-mystery pair system four-Cys motif protein [Myxococcales bacterium LLY-WYZ-16_1]|jgi:uncharacterized repeat protein (TIGR04052 family)|nr:metallo-mystery pair system four-Cys motif protein [Myxococcales bacterium LLY-WYZ-16_1]
MFVRLGGFRLMVASLCGAAVTACGDDGTGDGEREPVRIDFAATVRGQPAACGITLSGLGAGGTDVQLADARLFVSNLELRDAEGVWQPVNLNEDGAWQLSDLALLDFEDGTGSCSDSGSPETRTWVEGTAPAGAYRGLRLTVGVPFERNHLNADTSPAPLNVGSMFWAWQGGYKFVRVDWRIMDPQGDVPRWNIHVGSAGCVSASPLDPPEAECGRPNAARIVLPDFELDDTVQIDLQALVADVDLSSNMTMSPPGCMTNVMEAQDCDPVFDAMGLSFETGRCTENDCTSQGWISHD